MKMQFFETATKYPIHIVVKIGCPDIELTISVDQTNGRQSNIHTCTRTIWMMSPIVQQNIV